MHCCVYCFQIYKPILPDYMVNNKVIDIIDILETIQVYLSGLIIFLGPIVIRQLPQMHVAITFIEIDIRYQLNIVSLFSKT